jgi:hypothetical protein
LVAPGKFFSSDYFAARNRFREMVSAAGGRLEVIAIDAKGPQAEDLGIDVGWFGAANPSHVLLHSSGLHGVEGFAGSAIQLQFLNELPSVPRDTAFVIVHILNPYGMAWLRRCNENNVDLNRNFLTDGAYGGAPAAYARLDRFLNPPSPPRFDFFTLKATLLILRYGMPALRQAVVGGQYAYPKGLFFGGHRLEQGPARYKSFLSERLVSANRIVAIDVHTGLGKYGEDTLLAEEEDYDKLRAMFGERVAPSTPEESPAYRAQGVLSNVISQAVPKAEIFAITQEFGTYSPTKVLHALREENRWHHYGSVALDHPTKRILKKTFYPDDENWQVRVLQRGKELLEQALSI